jgi:TolB-like protein
MKRCPQCNHLERDETLKFCRNDGAILINDITPVDEFSDTRTLNASQTGEQRSVSDTGKTVSSTSVLDVRAKPATQSAGIAISKRKVGSISLLIGLGIVILGIAGLVAYRRAHNSEGPIDSIAVLPFENQNHDPDSEYLSDGLTESIIYRLSQLPNLKVSPRSSVFHYKGQQSDAIKVGNELRVNAVLSGRIIQRGEQITISTELTDVRYNKVLWGEQYDRKMSELLATQREIAGEIAAKLKLKISGEDQRLANKHYTESNEAYQSYLKGRFYWNKRTRDGYSKAIEYFKAAIENDPSFALAYAGLADSYNIMSSYGISSPKESFPLGKAAAMKALELDENLAEAHTSMAYVKYQYEWDWAGGEREFKRAIELNPNYPTAHHWYGLALANMGRLDEAFREMKRAQELDPLSVVIIASTGWVFYQAQRYDEAIAQYQKSLDMDQNFARSHWGIAEPYDLQGKYDKAIAELERARQLEDSPLARAMLAHAYVRAGRKSEAQKILNDLNQQKRAKYIDSYHLATIYAALGNKEQALQSLEDAFSDRSSWIVWIRLEPKFDSLRSDPRYASLMRRVGVSP